MWLRWTTDVIQYGNYYAVCELLTQESFGELTLHKRARLTRLPHDHPLQLAEVALVDRPHPGPVFVLLPPVGEEISPVNPGILAQPPEAEDLLRPADVAGRAMADRLLAHRVAPETFE